MRYSIALGALLLVFLAACGTSSNVSNTSRNLAGRDTAVEVTPQQAVDEAYLSQPYVETEEQKADWAQLENSPGRPGIDYDPQRMMVSFLPSAQLPAGWAAPSGFAVAAAGAQSNPELRRYKQFEPMAAAIAERYGIQLDVQVYYGSVLMAAYVVPDGVATDGILTRLRAEGAGMITHATYDPLRHCNYEPNDPNYVSSPANGTGVFNAPQWGHRRVRASDAWDYTLGDPSILIAVVDTGVRLTHEELAGQVLDPEVEFPTRDCDLANPDKTMEDTNGHGTYIAGLVGAKGGNGRTIIGLAPNCKVVPIKIANGDSTPDSLIAQGCLLADSIGCQVINLSWGGPGGNQVLSQMVNTCKNHGRFLAIAAGNDNTTANAYPGAYSDICVGATGSDTGQPDGRASYSNYGSYVDVAAPGTFLKSCKYTADNAYPTNSGGDWWESGTSFACPLVAAGAALLWSLDSTLTLEQVRTAIITTGDPTTGFTQGTVLRMNLASAFATVAGIRCSAPKLDKIIYSGTVALTPIVAGTPNAATVECRVNGVLRETLTAAPYTFNVDTSAITFGKVNVEFKAIDGADSATASVEFVADNGVSTYPLAEYFNAADPRVFEGVDVKGYSTAFLTALKSQAAGTWSADSLATSGAGKWTYPAAGGASGQGAYMGTLATGTYDNNEIDVLISRKVNLNGVVNPSLVFQQKYNVENGGSQKDKLRVVVTADGGATWTPAKLGGTSNDAVWSGDFPNFLQADVDLSAFAGQTVNVALVFEADGSGIGENAGSPKGWWVDSLILSRNYSTAIPTITGVTVTKPAVVDPLPSVAQAMVAGKAINLPEFDANITGPVQVSRVLYWLDLAPFGNLDLYDPVANVTGPNFSANLVIPKRDNQMAVLRVQYFDAANNPGPEVNKTIYLFNLLGDTNADGTVNQADLDLYSGKVGLTGAAAGYSVFLDSDLDGTITEADASAVGYNWGKNS